MRVVKRQPEATRAATVPFFTQASRSASGTKPARRTGIRRPWGANFKQLHVAPDDGIPKRARRDNEITYGA